MSDERGLRIAHLLHRYGDTMLESLEPRRHFNATGFVYDDTDSDGVRDTGEAGVAGATVYWDRNGNGTFDAGEPASVTDATGAYSVDTSDVGYWTQTRLRVQPPAGWYMTGPEWGYHAWPPYGADRNDFGLHQEPAALRVLVYADANEDGLRQDDEPSLSGAQVEMQSVPYNHLQRRSMLTNERGIARFDPPAGQYRFTASASSASRFGGSPPDGQVLTVDPATTTTIELGALPRRVPYSVMVQNDLNRDGKWASGDAPLTTPWVAYIDENDNGVLDAGEPSATPTGGMATLRPQVGIEQVIRVSAPGATFLPLTGEPVQRVTLNHGQGYARDWLVYARPEGSRFLQRDFNDDGIPDLFDFRNPTATTRGVLTVRTLDGNGVAETRTVTAPTDGPWTLGAVSDFDNDGHADIVWRDARSGRNRLWLMDQTTLRQAVDLRNVADRRWQIAGAGDINGDGQSDIVWRRIDTGQITLWHLNTSHQVAGYGSLPTPRNTNWQLAGVADFDRDGDADLLWHNKLLRATSMWLMNGGRVTEYRGVATPGAASGLNFRSLYNSWGDGTIDLLWQRSGTTFHSVEMMKPDQPYAVDYWAATLIR